MAREGLGIILLALLHVFCTYGFCANEVAGRILLSMPMTYSHLSASHILGKELTLRGWQVKVSSNSRLREALPASCKRCAAAAIKLLCLIPVVVLAVPGADRSSHPGHSEQAFHPSSRHYKLPARQVTWSYVRHAGKKKGSCKGIC